MPMHPSANRRRSQIAIVVSSGRPSCYGFTPSMYSPAPHAGAVAPVTAPRARPPPLPDPDFWPDDPCVDPIVRRQLNLFR